MTFTETKNEKWNSFAETTLLSHTSPSVPRRSRHTIGIPSVELPLCEEDSIHVGSLGSPKRSQSLSPSTSVQDAKKELNSSGTSSTYNASFSNHGPSHPPPVLSSQKRSGAGLVRPAVVSDTEKRDSGTNAPVVSNEEVEEEDFYLELNDDKPSKRNVRKIRRVRRGLTRRFSDSELSEASTINSCGENPKAVVRKQRLKERREARRAKNQSWEDDGKGLSLEEDDDVLDTDKDLAGLTGLAKPKARSKSLDDKPDLPLTETPPTQEAPLVQQPDKVPLNSRSGSLGKTSNHSKASLGSPTENRSSERKSRRSKNKGSSTGNRTRARSNRRRRYSDDENSSEEEDACTDRRARSNGKSGRPRRKLSKRRTRRARSSDDGALVESVARRKGRRPSPGSAGSLPVPQSLEIDVLQPDLVSPCTVASKSVRDKFSSHSASMSKKGSTRSKSTSSSRFSAITFTTGCSSVSSGAFDDDFSKISEQSNETIKTEQKSQASARRFPKGFLSTLQEVSMKSFTSGEKTPSKRPDNDGDVSKSSRFMPHKPRRVPSGNLEATMVSSKPTPPSFTPLSGCDESSDGETKEMPEETNEPSNRHSLMSKQKSSSALNQRTKRPTHLLRKAVSDRFLLSFGKGGKASKRGRRKSLERP